MSSINDITLVKGGAGQENLDQMKHHIAELEKCAGAYFRDIQRYMRQGPDFDLQSRFGDWNYAKDALERITADFSKSLKIRTRRAKIEQQAARKNVWEILHPQEYGTHDRDWIRSVSRATNRSPNNFVEEARDEALWYEPSNDFSSPAKLMMERPYLSSTSTIAPKEPVKPSRKSMTKQQKPAPATASRPVPKRNVPAAKTNATPVTTVSPVDTSIKTGEQSRPQGWVPPHLRGPQKNETTPTPVEKAIDSESIQKTVIKPKPKQQPEQSKETPKVPPHLRRGSQPASKEWPHQRQLLITPPATSPSTGSSTNKNPSPVSSSDSSAFGVLIDVSDTPATTVFDVSAGNNATHGTADVWEALMQLK
ncbi:hypothetical protein PG989_014056 [Apiospora arundinis]